MAVDGPHIPYPRVTAALQARDLAFIQRHAERLTLGLGDAAAVCELIAEQAPAQLEAAAVRWVRRYAVEASGQRWEDYRAIVAAFDALAAPGPGEGGRRQGRARRQAGAGGKGGRGRAARRLQALCAERGL